MDSDVLILEDTPIKLTSVISTLFFRCFQVGETLTNFVTQGSGPLIIPSLFLMVQEYLYYVRVRRMGERCTWK